MNCHFSTVFPSISQRFHCRFSSRDAPYQKSTRGLLESMLRLTSCILSPQILSGWLQKRRCRNLGYSDRFVYTSRYRLVARPAAPSTPLSSPLKIHHAEYNSPSLLCWQRATNLRESVSICIKQLHNTRKINENTNSGIKFVIPQLVKRNPLVGQLVQLFDNGIIRLHFCFREGFKLLIGVWLMGVEQLKGKFLKKTL